MIPWLRPDDPFPPAQAALREPNGLLAAGGALTPDRLVEAYSAGIFPWYSPGEPVLWWSPDPRMVLLPEEIKVSRSLGKTLARGEYEVRVDTAFRQVMAACASPRPGQHGTWITREIVNAYVGLHELGLAHSVETWVQGELAGGLYGVALGAAFYGESMFTRVPDASKIALVHLARQLARWNFGIIDCQMSTPHLASMGAREMGRAEFLNRLADLVFRPGRIGRWQFDHDLVE